MPEKHKLYWAYALAAALSPVLVSLLLLALFAQQPLTSYLPNKHNDAVGYWLQTRAFASVGFNNGCFVLMENVPAIGCYDAHGFAYPMLYGTLARLFGWHEAFIPITHHVVIALALLLCIALTHPTLRQMSVLAVGVACFPILLLYLPIAMQEPLHFGIALVLGGFLVRGLKRGRLLAWEFAACLLLLTVASLLRFWWAIVLLPVLWLALPPHWSWQRRGLLSVVATGVFVLLALRVYGLMASPGANSIITVLEGFRVSLPVGIELVLKFVYSGIRGLLVLYFNSLNTFSTLFVGGILILSGRQIARNRFDFVAWLSFYLLGFSFILGFTSYSYNNFGRFFAMPLLLLFVVWVLLDKRAWWRAVLVYALVSMPLFFVAYAKQAATEFQAEPVVVLQTPFAYDLAAPVWCNTVALDVRLYDSRLTTLPVGIGVSWWWYNTPFDTYSIPKAKYLWLETYYYNIWKEVLTVENPFIVREIVNDSVFLENRYPDCGGDVLAGVWAGNTPAYIPVEYFDAPFAQRRDSFTQATAFHVRSTNTPTGQVIVPDAPFWVRPADGVYRQLVLANPADKTLTLLPSLTERQAQALATALQDGQAYVAPNGERAGVFVPVDRLELTQARSNQPIATFDGALELLSVDVPDELVAGEWLPVRLRWRLNAPTKRNYHVFLQVWDTQMVNRAYYEGEYDEKTGREHLYYHLYPTSRWQVGEVVEHTRVLRVAEDAPQGGYRLAVSVVNYYEDKNTGILPRFAVNDQSEDKWAIAAKTRITPQFAPLPDDAQPLDAMFGDALALTAWYVARDDDNITLTLAWRADVPVSEDYTLFIHALNDAGEMVAQRDEPLLGGLYPTSYWAVGQTLVTRHVLDVLADADVARYAIGLYHPVTFERLPAAQDGQSAPDNAIRLGE